ncbi:alpha/beta hydrolase [Thalassotalea fusca]
MTNSTLWRNIGLSLALWGLSLANAMSSPWFDDSNAKMDNKNQPVPIVSAHEYQHQSEILRQTRRYQVALPERYHMNKRQYPTLYVIDADFQFQHVSAVIKNLTRMGKIPPMIVVGIANQGDDDYLMQTTWPVEDDPAFGGAANFQRYLKDELVPLIDGEFHTNDKKALAGYSLGGLFTMFSMMQADTPFNAFLSMSPSAWFDDYSLPQKLKPLLEQGKISAPVFLSVAREQQMGVDKVVEVFEQYAADDLPWQFKHYPQENHFSTALPALYDGLVFLAPDFATDGTDMLEMGDYKQVLSHFDKLRNQWAGFQFEWLQAYQFAKYMFWSKQLDQVDNVLLDIKKQFPESLTQVSIELAKGFNKRKDYKRAKQLLDAVNPEGQLMPGWHKQMRIYWQANGESGLAQQHQQTAMTLAKQYYFESWEIWELQ